MNTRPNSSSTHCAMLQAFTKELGRAGWRFDPPELGLVFAARPPQAIQERALARARGAGYFLLPCSVLDAAECRSAVRFSVMAPADGVRRALQQLVKRESKGSQRSATTRPSLTDDA
jgi:hypothetical protein